MDLLSTLPPTLRGLLRRPAASVLAVATLAAGVAASCLAFVLVDAALLTPLPFRDPARLVTVEVTNPSGHSISMSVPNYRDWGERSQAFERVGAMAGWGGIMSGRGAARVVDARVTCGDVFGLLGVEAQMGRVLGAADAEPGAAPVVLLGHAFWQRLGADPAILESSLTLDGVAFTVVGVLPPGVGYPSATTEVYFGLGTQPRIPWDDRNSGFGLRLFGRLREGVTVASAQVELERITEGIAAGSATPLERVDRPRVRPLSELMVGELRRPLALVFVAAALVVLLAVANVGSLFLARAEARRGDLAVRLALGAPRNRLWLESLAEAGWLAVTGGVIGLALTAAAVPLLATRVASLLPAFVVDRLSIGPATIMFALALVTLLAVLIALAPTLIVAAVRESSQHAVTHGGRTSAGPRATRLRTALVVGELALGTVLVVGAGLLASTVDSLAEVDRGFDQCGVAAGRLAIPDGRLSDVASYRAFHDRLLSRVSSLPGVDEAAVSLLVPLANRSWEQTLYPEGVPLVAGGGDSVLFNIVSPGYFSLMRVPLVDGRLFGEADRDGGELVVVVDRSLADRYWPGESALGRKVTFESNPTESGGTEPVYRTIVGVVANLRHYELQTPSRIQVYIPFAQTRGRFGFGLNLLARTAGDPAPIAALLPRAVADIDPDVPLSGVAPLAANVDRALAQPRLLAAAVSLLGALAVALAGIGVFALASLAVGRRWREIGIRQVLGATPAKIVASVLGEGLRWCVLGTSCGLLLALGAAQLARSLLFGVAPWSPSAHLGALLVLGGVVLIACMAPALAAVRIHPATVLRADP